MFEETIKSVTKQVNERLSSPLMGSFIIAWCFWNYKFIIVLFSKSSSVQQTFQLIDTLVFPEVYTLLLKGLVLPLLSTIAYVFLYPYPSKFAYAFTQRRQKEINDIRRTIENETPLTLEESRMIRSEGIQMEAKYVQEIDRKNIEIKRLKAEIEMSAEIGVSNKNDVQEMELDDLELKHSQLSMLQLIDSQISDVGMARETTLIEKSNESRLKAEYDLTELVARGYINREFRESSYVYEFTHLGRSYLLNNLDLNAMNEQ